MQWTLSSNHGTSLSYQIFLGPTCRVHFPMSTSLDGTLSLPHGSGQQSSSSRTYLSLITSLHQKSYWFGLYLRDMPPEILIFYHLILCLFQRMQWPPMSAHPYLFCYQCHVKPCAQDFRPWFVCDVLKFKKSSNALHLSLLGWQHLFKFLQSS